MPLIEHVTSNTSLPSRADAVVVGGGIIGILTALELSERGLFVVVVEKGGVAAEQSSRNWGWCRQMGRDPREIPLIRVALEKWRGMNQRIDAETGFRSSGIYYMSEDEKGLAKHMAWQRTIAEPNGLSTRIVTGKEIAAAVKGGVRSWRGGLFSPNDGRAEPFLAVPAMARALQNRGGMVFTNCAARGIEQAAGKVHGLVTEKGTIRTDTVVVAGGYWTRRFLGNLNIRFPQIGVVNSVMRTTARDTGITHTISGGIYSARKRLDGGFTVTDNEVSVAEITPSHISQFLPFLPLMLVGAKEVKMRFGQRFFAEAKLANHWALDQASPFEAIRILDPKPYSAVLSRAFDALKKDYPAFQGMDIAESWAGMIDATPDAVPVIDRIKQVPGLFVASGFSGHGFGLGPGAAQLMAEIVTGETPCVDPKPFRHGRFGRFATAKPTTGL